MVKGFMDGFREGYGLKFLWWLLNLKNWMEFLREPQRMANFGREDDKFNVVNTVLRCLWNNEVWGGMLKMLLRIVFRTWKIG